MRKSGGAAIHMQQNSTENQISFLVADESFLENCPSTPVKTPFDKDVLDYLDCVSKKLLSSPASKLYPDVITFAFWIRRASINTYKNAIVSKEGQRVVGRGVVFHVAPSNVAVNFAYSLVSGLLAGNINIVRVPSKQFPQVNIIASAIKSTLEEHPCMSDYVCLIRYGHDKDINDRLSLLSDVRIIWGGDETISIFRESPLKPRATEILFANRFSIAIIDSETYLGTKDKKRVAQDFYNDTYLTDQNACSSPRVIVWMGKDREKAKTDFWHNVHEVVSEKYRFQQIQGVDKYLQVCLTATKLPGSRSETSEDNLITRIHIDCLEKNVTACFGNSGLFLEYDAADISEIMNLCDDNRCQTVTYLCDPEIFDPLLNAGLKGVDRIVPFGKSMDFELVWDGYDLITQLSRIIRIRTK